MKDSTWEKTLIDYYTEDCPRGDITSEITPSQPSSAQILAEEDGVLAGIEECKFLCEHLGLDVKTPIKDGARIHNGDVVLEIDGESRALLSVERTLLNILSKMSGIATLTRAYTEEIEKHNTGAKVSATRKTTPGFRLLGKKAVEVGGGLPHRMTLSDMILLKENHLAFFGSVGEAVKAAKERVGEENMEVEVDSKEDAMAAAEAGADIIMLDNMNPQQIADVIEALKEAGLRDNVVLEASGGVNLENIGDYTKSGVNVLSTSAITMAAKPLSFSLDIV